MKRMIRRMFLILATGVLAACNSGSVSGSSIKQIKEALYKQRMSYFRQNKGAPGCKLIIGDSLTNFWPESKFPQGWLNRGIGGDDTVGVLARLDYHISEQPSEVALFIGANNTASASLMRRYSSDLAQIISRLQTRLPGVKIYIISILPSNNGSNALLESLGKDERKVAYAYKLDYINAHDALLRNGAPVPSNYLSDGLHLTDAGYDAISMVINTKLVEFDARPGQTEGLCICST